MESVRAKAVESLRVGLAVESMTIEKTKAMESLCENQTGELTRAVESERVD